jgi:hypothetical protein
MLSSKRISGAAFVPQEIAAKERLLLMQSLNILEAQTERRRVVSLQRLREAVSEDAEVFAGPHVAHVHAGTGRNPRVFKLGAGMM